MITKRISAMLLGGAIIHTSVSHASQNLSLYVFSPLNLSSVIVMQFQ